ncbi:hypothetical protein TrST_g9333 [Triparma strigata]|uniref:PUB domain-containing protein n=1 Tax=Triparma strigata TaxID=1606541 RepID=A0A9W7C6X3_9STRA|nr:hypothetical protein TrST_g9333 [Triparma strigata]
MSEFKKSTILLEKLSLELEELHEAFGNLPPLPPPSETLSVTTSPKLTDFESIRTQAEELLGSKIERYRQRLTEKDPVTGNDRYGDKMKKSVTEFIASYEKFSEDLANVFAPEGVYESLRQREATEAENMVRAEEERRKAKEEEERLAKIRAEEERLASLTEQQRQEENEAKEREELRIKAEIARKERQEREAREREEQERKEREEHEAERAWINSIEVGPAGFKFQLERLPLSARKCLLQLYTQINSRPEDELTRKVKLDNERFHEDCGQYEGGQEALIAAGWKLQTLENIKYLTLVEPNLETNLDAWSDWYDAIKANLVTLKEILEP